MANTGKYALITGATSGIGYELAKLFAKDNYNLVLVARSEENLERVAAELGREGIEVLTRSVDLFDNEAPFELYAHIKEQGIRIDVLVNDAGQGEFGKFIDTDLRKELDIIQLNVTSVVILTKLYLKEMVQRGEGKILNLSSIAGKIPGPYQAVYHGTKAFIDSFTEAIRSEVKETGVTITALLPGPTDTDFFHKAHMENSKIVQEGDLEDAAKVAKDGYEALMSGKAAIISGTKNKMQVAMGNLAPDSKAADMLGKNQEPVTHEEEHRR